MTKLYVLSVIDDGDEYQYEYGNLKHANEAYDNEEHCTLFEYVDGNHHFIKSK